MHRSSMPYSYWMDGWKDRRLARWIDIQVDERIKGCIDRHTGKSIGNEVDRCQADGLLDGWVDG